MFKSFEIVSGNTSWLVMDILMNLFEIFTYSYCHMNDFQLVRTKQYNKKQIQKKEVEERSY